MKSKQRKVISVHLSIRTVYKLIASCDCRIEPIFVIKIVKH